MTPPVVLVALAPQARQAVVRVPQKEGAAEWVLVRVGDLVGSPPVRVRAVMEDRLVLEAADESARRIFWLYPTRAGEPARFRLLDFRPPQEESRPMKPQISPPRESGEPEIPELGPEIAGDLDPRFPRAPGKPGLRPAGAASEASSPQDGDPRSQRPDENSAESSSESVPKEEPR